MGWNLFRGRIRLSLLATAIVFSFPFQLWGGSAAPSEAERISELEKRLEEHARIIEKLVERIRELEKKPPQNSHEPVAAAGGSSPPVAALVNAPAASESDLSIFEDVTWLHGFADVGLTYSGRHQGDNTKRKGFSVGALDFYLTPQLGPRVKGLAELIFEVNNEGETMAELERLQIGYSFNDYLTLWGGRYHTPLGYWNTTFHHGKQIQTTILRPKFLDFEEDDGVLPVHMTGLWGSGTARFGDGKMNYDLYVANGPKIKDLTAGGDGRLEPNSFTDDNHNLALGFNVSYDFTGALDGLRLGMHGLRTDVDGYDSADHRLSRSELNILGGYGIYTTNDWEIMGEFYQFLNRDRSGGSGYHSSAAGFLQAGRLIGRFTPYGRFEFASFDQKDNYFSRLKEGFSYRRGLAGVRFDLSPKTALKVEGNHTRILNREHDDYFEISSQLAIHF